MKTGITFSAFDLLHAGHILMLKECKDNCDHLIVGLQVDPSRDREFKNRPVQSLYERFVQLSAVKYVDEIIVYETEEELEQILLSTNANIRFIGEEYHNQNFTGKDICNERGIKLFFNSRLHTYSSTELRDRVKNS